MTTRQTTNRAELVVASVLLAVSFTGSVVLAAIGAPVVGWGTIPWLVLLSAAIAGLRWWWFRPGRSEAERAQCFWLNMALAAGAVVLSPVFALYAFLGYVESVRFARRSDQILSMVATALVVAYGQLGGRDSAIYRLDMYAAFVAIHLAIASVMLALDRRREALLAELEEANTRLRAEQARSAALLDQNVAQAWEAGVTEERQRLSREIHDTVAQDLVAIITQIGAAIDAPDEPERQHRLAIADGAARDALGEARRAVRALASPRLDDTELPLALDDLLGEWRETHDLDGELTVAGAPAATGRDDALLRVAQEALTNVARHAHATRADVALTYRPGATTLEVRDDGRGFDPDQQAAGFGLAGMRARMEVSGGTLEVDATPGGPSVIRATLPVPDAEVRE